MQIMSYDMQIPQMNIQCKFSVSRSAGNSMLFQPPPRVQAAAGRVYLRLAKLESYKQAHFKQVLLKNNNQIILN